MRVLLAVGRSTGYASEPWSNPSCCLFFYPNPSCCLGWIKAAGTETAERKAWPIMECAMLHWLRYRYICQYIDMSICIEEICLPKIARVQCNLTAWARGIRVLGTTQYERRSMAYQPHNTPDGYSTYHMYKRYPGFYLPHADLPVQQPKEVYWRERSRVSHRIGQMEAPAIYNSRHIGTTKQGSCLVRAVNWRIVNPNLESWPQH